MNWSPVLLASLTMALLTATPVESRGVYLTGAQRPFHGVLLAQSSLPNPTPPPLVPPPDSTPVPDGMDKRRPLIGDGAQTPPSDEFTAPPPVGMRLRESESRTSPLRRGFAAGVATLVISDFAAFVLSAPLLLAGAINGSAELTIGLIIFAANLLLSPLWCALVEWHLLGDDFPGGLGRTVLAAYGAAAAGAAVLVLGLVSIPTLSFSNPGIAVLLLTVAILARYVGIPLTASTVLTSAVAYTAPLASADGNERARVSAPVLFSF